jgi:hypothetical protein
MARLTVMFSLILVLFFFACTHDRQGDELVVVAPPGFSGQVHVELGVAGSPPLEREHGAYLVRIAGDGRASTSTILSASPKFNGAGLSQIWGYAFSMDRTGDGLPVGGRLEFFVGTKEQYETYEAKKHKSQQIPARPADCLECKPVVLS